MKVAILMGSPRDDEKMAGATEMLERFGVQHEVHVMSAHRNPEKVGDFASNARDNGFAAIFAALAWQPISLALCRLTPPCP